MISARGNHEAQCPNAPGEWKVQAFLEVQKQLDSQVVTNLISVGDSNFEMDAVHIMGKEFSHAVVKTIKFKEHPTAQELHKELELTAQKFEKIALNASNLKISLERKDTRPGGARAGTNGGQQHSRSGLAGAANNSDGRLSAAILAAAESRKSPVVEGFKVPSVPSPVEPLAGSTGQKRPSVASSDLDEASTVASSGNDEASPAVGTGPPTVSN